MQLQEAVMHQQEEILRLSEELYAQQKAMDEMRQMLQALKAKNEALENTASGDEPPPPHY